MYAYPLSCQATTLANSNSNIVFDIWTFNRNLKLCTLLTTDARLGPTLLYAHPYASLGSIDSWTGTWDALLGWDNNQPKKPWEATHEEQKQTMDRVHIFHIVKRQKLTWSSRYKKIIWSRQFEAQPKWINDIFILFKESNSNGRAKGHPRRYLWRLSQNYLTENIFQKLTFKRWSVDNAK